jgi:hypothetical protein
MWSRSVFLILLFIAGNGGVLSAHAVNANADHGMQAVTSGNSYLFEFDRQPLLQALENFSALTGISGLYDSSVIAGKMASPVYGELTDKEALDRLLEGTGLSAFYTDKQAFVLETKRALTASEPVTVTASKYYDSMIQKAVRKVFCKHEDLANGNYRIAVRFYLDKKGQVYRPELLDASGDAQKNHMILQAMQQVNVGVGPAVISEPFYLLILPNQLSKNNGCKSTS